MKYTNTIETLTDYGIHIRKTMRDTLIKNNKRASGRLINSIDFDIVKVRKNLFELQIDFAPYGRYVAGRNKKMEPNHSPKWTRKGPPVRVIRNWVIDKNVRFSSLNKKGLSYNKKVDIMTYLIIKKIKERKRLNPRYKNPTDFIKPFDKMVASKRYNEDVRTAMIKDIMIDLKKNY